MLPTYCRGTQGLRVIIHNPRPIKDYEKIYGHTFIYLHHYCYALYTEKKTLTMRDQFLRDSKLNYALGDIKFVLDRATPNFVLLPEIYTTKARILFTLHRDSKAASALLKAISANAGFTPAILRLSDYYAEHGDNKEAIKVLKQGVDNAKNSSLLIKKLKQLGITYQPPQRSAPQKLKSNMNEPKSMTTTPSASPLPRPSDSPDVAHANRKSPKSDPYCRFCPP